MQQWKWEKGLWPEASFLLYCASGCCIPIYTRKGRCLDKCLQKARGLRFNNNSSYSNLQKPVSWLDRRTLPRTCIPRGKARTKTYGSCLPDLHFKKGQRARHLYRRTHISQSLWWSWTWNRTHQKRQYSTPLLENSFDVLTFVLVSMDYISWRILESGSWVRRVGRWWIPRSRWGKTRR